MRVVLLLLLCCALRAHGVIRTLEEREAAAEPYNQKDFWNMNKKPDCVGAITDLTAGGKTSGEFDDGSAPTAFYAANMDKCWNIPTAGKKEIKFVRLAVERGYDFVRIYTLVNGVASFLKDISPGDVITTDKPVQVHMHSDGSVQDYGFDASWKMEKANVPETHTHNVPAGPLKVTFNVNHNDIMTAHKTNKYKNDGTMLTRRGVPFKFTVAGTTSKITHVILELLGDGARIVIEVGKPAQAAAFGCTAAISGSDVVVNIPADGPVGEYKLGVRLQDNTEHNHEANVCVFFNPYNAADDVFVAQADWLQEYVENAQGAVWTADTPKPWDYAQYETVMYHATFVMLSKMRLSLGDRRSPVMVSRALSSIVNSNDGGILEGRWKSDFPGGQKPWSWEGSLDIVRKWYQEEKAVKYGQCWVFAGVLTSVCRAVGIAARAVTNMNSAHEAKPFDQVVLSRWTKNGDKWVKDDTSDSVWNFHVWNEVWMKRPDIGRFPEAAGWQAIDATPQEVSDRLMQCGPGSLNLMQRGILTEPYDTPFIKGEINSLQMTEVRDSPSQNSYRFYSNDSNAIGTALWTKARGTGIRGEDVKAAYKTRQTGRGSLLEVGSGPARLSIFGKGGAVITVPDEFTVELVVNVNRHGDSVFLQVSDEGVENDAKQTKSQTPVAPSKGGKAHAKGKTHIKGYQVTLDCYAINYFGKKLDGDNVLTTYMGALNEQGSVRVTIPYTQYKRFIGDTLSFECQASVQQPSSKQPACLLSSRVTLAVPPIVVETQKPTMAIGDYLPVVLRWTNPLSEAIVAPVLRVQVSASGVDTTNFKTMPDIGAKATVRWEVHLKSSVIGVNQVSIALEAKELYGVSGEGEVTVKLPPAASESFKQSIERRSSSPLDWTRRFSSEVQRELSEMAGFLHGRVRRLASFFNNDRAALRPSQTRTAQEQPRTKKRRTEQQM